MPEFRKYFEKLQGMLDRQRDPAPAPSSMQLLNSPEAWSGSFSQATLKSGRSYIHQDMPAQIARDDAIARWCAANKVRYIEDPDCTMPRFDAASRSVIMPSRALYENMQDFEMDRTSAFIKSIKTGEPSLEQTLGDDLATVYFGMEASLCDDRQLENQASKISQALKAQDEPSRQKMLLKIHKEASSKAGYYAAKMRIREHEKRMSALMAPWMRKNRNGIFRSLTKPMRLELYSRRFDKWRNSLPDLGQSMQRKLEMLSLKLRHGNYETKEMASLLSTKEKEMLSQKGIDLVPVKNLEKNFAREHTLHKEPERLLKNPPKRTLGMEHVYQKLNRGLHQTKDPALQKQFRDQLKELEKIRRSGKDAISTAQSLMDLSRDVDHTLRSIPQNEMGISAPTRNVAKQTPGLNL